MSDGPSSSSSLPFPHAENEQQRRNNEEMQHFAPFTEEDIDEFDELLAKLDSLADITDLEEKHNREQSSWELRWDSSYPRPSRCMIKLPVLSDERLQKSDLDDWELPRSSSKEPPMIVPDVQFPDFRASKGYSYPSWPQGHARQWTAGFEPGSCVSYINVPRSKFVVPDKSSPSSFAWEEDLFDQEDNVSVAMPNMMDQRPDMPSLPTQVGLGFNWITRLAPWELFSQQDAEAKVPYPLLPPQSAEHRGRKTLVLDLDETLLHCNVKLNEPGAIRPEIMVDIRMGPKHSIPASVHLRPHTQELLQKAAQMFEVVVFTASIEAYAKAVVDLLDKDRQWVSAVLCRTQCTEINGQLLKDMRRLGRRLEDVVLVDNSPLACGISPENSIVCQAFYGNDPGDMELLRLRSQLLKLSKVPSLPIYLDERYGLARFVKKERQTLRDTGQL